MCNGRSEQPRTPKVPEKKTQTAQVGKVTVASGDGTSGAVLEGSTLANPPWGTVTHRGTLLKVTRFKQ